MKKKITLLALSARIKRKLMKENNKLVKFSPKDQSGYGDYGLVDLTTNTISAYHIDIEKFAKEIGALHDYEELV